MRIDAIVLREIKMPLVHPFETSFGMTTGRRILLIELQVRGTDGLGRVRRRRTSVLQARVDRHRVAHASQTGTGSDAASSASVSMAATARRSSARCAATAWRRPRWKTPSGTSKRRSRRHPAVRAAGRDPQRDSVRRIDRHSAFAMAQLMEKIETRAGRRLPAHQAEVQAGLGHGDLRGGAQALAGDHAELSTPTRPTG